MTVPPMTVARTKKIAVGLTLALALALGAGACGETASTSSFTGESHAVAQAVADLQSDVTGRDEKKLCQNDLAAAVTARLRSGGGCQAVLKKHLLQIDAPSLTIESISVTGNKATAQVKSTYSGKDRLSTLTLVKEGGRWKVSGTG